MNRDILFEEHPYEPVQPGTPPTAGERCSVPRNQREELKEIILEVTRWTHSTILVC